MDCIRLSHLILERVIMPSVPWSDLSLCKLFIESTYHHNKKRSCTYDHSHNSSTIFELCIENIDWFPLFSAVNLDFRNTTLAFSCDPNNYMIICLLFVQSSRAHNWDKKEDSYRMFPLCGETVLDLTLLTFLPFFVCCWRGRGEESMGRVFKRSWKAAVSPALMPATPCTRI